MNWHYVFVSALIPLVVGFIWYNPKVFGNMWMKSSGMTPEMSRSSNMVVVFGLTYVFGLFLSVALMPMVIHQMHMFSIYANDPNAQQPGSELMQFMEKHGTDFRTFKHGVFHGFLESVLFVLPIVGILALFEAKKGKYIFVHWGYWAVTLMLMGGFLCAMM